MPSGISCSRDRASPEDGKKREELARVLERLRAPGLRQGIARELSKQVEILEREIAGLEQT